MKPIALMDEAPMIEYGCFQALYVIKEQTVNLDVVPDTNEGIDK